MTYPGSQLLGRASSLSQTLDAGPRHSLDLPAGGVPRSRRGSVDLRAGRESAILASSVLSARSRDGVQLEVGRSVDVNEQRRRLEQYWNTNDSDDLAENRSVEVGSLSEAEESSSEPRAYLEQRWQSQSAQDDTSGQTRRSVGRRRVEYLKSKRGRHGGRQRCRSLAESRTSVPRLRDPGTSSSEVADQRFLNKLSAVSSLGTPLGATHLKLLDRSTELELGRIVQLGVRTQEILDKKEEESGRMLSPEEQEEAVGVSFACITMRLSNQHLAHHLFIRFNFRLMCKIAKSFEGRGLAMEDLILEATCGLEKAISRFDPTKGHKFGTFAYMWIRQAVGRSIAENARLVTVPNNVYELIGRIHRVRQTLRGRGPDGEVEDDQIAAALGEPVERIALCARAGKAPSSLEGTVVCDNKGLDNPLMLADVVPDTAPTADEELVEEDSQRLLKQDVDRVLTGLSLRERNVLRYRYGLLTDAVSLADLSTAYGVSKERIRSIGEIALAKLQLRQSCKGRANVHGRVRKTPILHPESYRPV